MFHDSGWKQGWGGRFSFSVDHRRKENTAREKRAQKFLQSPYIYIYLYCLVLLGLLIVTARPAPVQQSEQTEVKKALGIEGRLFCSPAPSSSSGG